MRRGLAALAAACGLAVATPAAAQISPLDASAPIPYFIAPGDPATGVTPADRELARWALEQWRRAAGGPITLVEAPEAEALVRLYWAPPTGGQYGEMRPLLVGRRLGAAVYIRPDVRALGPEIAAAATADPLFRDTIVFLTCLHELGHAFGLEHTAAYADIMYSFQYGGDFVAYFTRYRARLAGRDDIATTSGLSPVDEARLRALYPAGPER